MLRVALPAAVRQAMKPSPSVTPTPTSSPTPPATPPPGSREDSELPEQDTGQRSSWGWALGGLLGLGIVLVLVRALRPR